jgi:TRAP-type mannitol/chloroaromatic compound transport system permease small subunit
LPGRVDESIIGPMKILRRLAAGIDGLNDAIGAVIRWLALIMVLIGATGAVLRYFSRGWGLALNLTPAIEAQWYLFSLIFLMGAAYGLNKNVHVRVDVMYERLSERAQGWIDLIGTLVFLVPFSVMMLWVSYPIVRESFRVRETSPDPGGLPRWPIKMLIIVSFVLLLLQAVSQVVRHVDRIRGESAGVASDDETEVPV